MVIREAEKTNNCAAARNFSITENNVRRWRQQKDELSNAHCTRMAFRGPKKGRFNEIDVSVVKFITAMRLQGFPVTREAIYIKGQEIARSLNISEDQFKGSMGWCKRMMLQNGLSLR
jgi:DNA-binding transcriptional regulator YiaG